MFTYNHMKVLALIQARMGSTRFPGKVLTPVLGKPMLAWQLERLARSLYITEIVVATSTLDTDQPIADFCAHEGVPCFRGSHDNVLSRFWEASNIFLKQEDREDACIIRLTGDCPLIDPATIDDGIVQFQTARTRGCRYFGWDGALPDGMDFEIFTWDALCEAYERATDSFEKEHVTPYMWRNPAQFGMRTYRRAGIAPGLRFSVDHPEDRDLVEEILRRQIAAGRFFGMQEISDLLSRDTTLAAINSDIIKNEGLIITSLASEPFQVEEQGQTIPKYGIAVPLGSVPERIFFIWAERVGIKVWCADEEVLETGKGVLSSTVRWKKDTLPSGWKIFSPAAEGWRDELWAVVQDPSVKGVLFETADRTVLSQLLMFVCQEQFQRASC